MHFYKISHTLLMLYEKMEIYDVFWHSINHKVRTERKKNNNNNINNNTSLDWVWDWGRETKKRSRLGWMNMFLQTKKIKIKISREQLDMNVKGTEEETFCNRMQNRKVLPRNFTIVMLTIWLDDVRLNLVFIFIFFFNYVHINAEGSSSTCVCGCGCVCVCSLFVFCFFFWGGDGLECLFKLDQPFHLSKHLHAE